LRALLNGHLGVVQLEVVLDIAQLRISPVILASLSGLCTTDSTLKHFGRLLQLSSNNLGLVYFLPWGKGSFLEVILRTNILREEVPPATVAGEAVLNLVVGDPGVIAQLQLVHPLLARLERLGFDCPLVVPAGC